MYGIKEFVKIIRTTYKKCSDKKPSIETSYYISSKHMSAKDYNYGIRAHWGVESMHYVKDVTFKEDASLIRTGNAPINFSIIRNIVINLLRKKDYISFPQAIRMLGGDIEELVRMVV